MSSRPCSIGRSPSATTPPAPATSPTSPAAGCSSPPSPIDLTHACADALRGLPGVELVAAPQLSLLAFRHVPAGAEDGPMLDAHNARLLAAINRRGRVYLTPTVAAGRYVIRSCVLSFRTHRDRVDAALEDIAAALAEVGW